MNIGPITISNQAAKPGNSQIVPLLDTTYWNDSAPWAAAATAAAPGKSRGQLAGMRVTGTILTTTQNVTLTFQVMTTPAGTTAAAAFETDTNGPGAGSVTVVAGTTQPFSWLPYTPDYRIIVTAGGTAPATMVTTLVLVDARTSGA